RSVRGPSRESKGKDPQRKESEMSSLDDANWFDELMDGIEPDLDALTAAERDDFAALHRLANEVDPEAVVERAQPDNAVMNTLCRGLVAWRKAYGLTMQDVLGGMLGRGHDVR